jgi:23S rRNA (cytidine1920-2'-O)/16S rRNA (cytidine1409-2'-O)-methyltransferase
LIIAGRVLVNGVPVRNPRSLVARDASVTVEEQLELRGTKKLRAALAAFRVDVRGRVVVDFGASTGGFCVALLEAGAARVYAVDVGHGQLLGSLRQDPRIINKERTNLAEARLPEPVGLVTMDLAYLSVASAAAQLGALSFTEDAQLIALVKPMFELARATAPTDHESLAEALDHAARGLEANGWRVLASIASPVEGARGAREGFVHAVRVSAP